MTTGAQALKNPDGSPTGLFEIYTNNADELQLAQMECSGTYANIRFTVNEEGARQIFGDLGNSLKEAEANADPS